MKYKLPQLSFVLLLLFFSCDGPSSPDFEMQHSLDIPLIKSVTYNLVGKGNGAIIDTTSEDYDNFFEVGSDGLISLSSEIDFGIGDFGRVVPAINVEPMDVDAEIGMIEVSFTGRGSASYETITGMPPSEAPEPGMPIPAGESPEFDIEVDVSDFERGVIESGGISARITNQLGFDINELEATFLSGGTPISGPEMVTDINHGEQKSLTFQFQSQVEIVLPVTIRMQFNWNSQTVASEPDDLLVNVFDSELLARSVTAVIRSQEFYTEGTIDIDDDNFRFQEPSHFVAIEEGYIILEQIVNEIDVGIDTLVISFPNIRMDFDGSGIYAIEDSLWFEFSGTDKIHRGNDPQMEQPEIRQSLENAKIYASGNKIDYNVKAVTEDTRTTQDGDSIRTVGSTDRFFTTVDIHDINIEAAFGVVQPRVELLNDDVDDDGVLDLFNDNEAEITRFDDLESLSERISGIQLFNPNFDLIYDTNLGIDGTIIAAIVGINDDGEMVYLSGKPGTDLGVGVDDDFHGLTANGVQIDRSNLISIDIEPADDIGEIVRNRVVRFDSESSKVGDFLSNLPEEIRFIGKVVANPVSSEGFIVEPVEFDTNLGIDIPLDFSTAEGEPASIEDTVSVDMSDLPSPEDDFRLSEMTLFITYDNGLPFSTGLNLQFLDEFNELITSEEGRPLAPVHFNIDPARVDEVTRFVNQPKSGVTEIRLTGEQLDNLYRTRKLRIDGNLATSRDDISGRVKLRSNDFIKLGIDAGIKTSIRAN